MILRTLALCLLTIAALPSFAAAQTPHGWKNPQLDTKMLQQEFQQPPVGFGNVAFYWWLGDPLTKERLSWQLDQLAEMGAGMTGVQINYAHSDKGGHLWGYTYPSEPGLFTESWWELVDWYMQEAKKHGISVSLSDYTLGISQGWKWDEAIAAYPEIVGSVLQCETFDVAAGETIKVKLSEASLSVAAWTEERLINLLDSQSAPSNDAICEWKATAKAKVFHVRSYRVDPSIDPMHPESGKAVVEKFFQPFEDKFPDESGRGLNFFFSDELDFRVHGRLWNKLFADEFQRRKGYDILPQLAALYGNVGPQTVKVRLDYNDVLSALSEENYFKPVYDWHQERGMTYGCDHGGRGRNLTEFGDYFRTQRWNQGPGSDQPGLGKDIVKAKVAASIAHLNERPRVWLEGFYGSGWGTSSEQIVDATFANFLMGYNLLSLHGLYYSTHGGWWEWAPPCNHWRMPYWKHYKPFFDATQRLSYLLTQGHHVCDVAVYYPVASAEAGVDANESIGKSFSMVEQLYRNGIDVDFIDFESVERAAIKDGRLNIAGESYRVLVLPHPKVLRHAMLEKVVAFAEAGGIVVTLGALPEYSDRVGANDSEVTRLASLLPQDTRFDEIGKAVEAIRGMFRQDIVVSNAKKPFYFVHRNAAEQDIYVFYQLPENAEITVRAVGRAETWDVWTGERKPFAVLEQDQTNGTRFQLTNKPEELQVLVFSPGKAELVADLKASTKVAEVVKLDGAWQSDIIPTMDNTFGDYRIPAVPGQLIGPEARRFRYAVSPQEQKDWLKANVNDSQWAMKTYAFGPKFRQLGPLPANLTAAEQEALETGLIGVTACPEATQKIGEKTYSWRDYDFSWRYGVEGDPGHQGYHGLKENMYDEFIRLGKYAESGHLHTVRQPEQEGTRYYLWTTVVAPKSMTGVILTHGMQPAALWVNGLSVDKESATIELKSGPNPVLLRYDQPGIGYFVVVSPDSPWANEAQNTGLSKPTMHDNSSWIWNAPGEGGGQVSFRREFNVAASELPQQAVICMTADDDFTLWLNGQQLGKGQQWNRIACFDVTKILRSGKNVIAVKATNSAGPRGMIGELRMIGKEEQFRLLATDKTWLCTDSPKDGWTELDFDQSQWKPAVVISPFAGSLWATHESMGPPILQNTDSFGVEHETTGPLAMRWYDTQSNCLKPGILPFDIFGGKTMIGHFRFFTPPGATSIIVPHPKAKAFADGRELSSKLGDDRLVVFDLGQQFSAKEKSVTVCIPLSGGEYGASVLSEPIAFQCGQGEMATGDWSKMESLRTYSGGIRYSKTMTLDKAFFANNNKVVLDLGHVVSSAKVSVNGQSAGTKVSAPWRFDVSELLREGENRIEIEVCNTLGNHYLTIPTRYRGMTESGLIGPVVLEKMSRE